MRHREPALTEARATSRCASSRRRLPRYPIRRSLLQPRLSRIAPRGTSSSRHTRHLYRSQVMCDDVVSRETGNGSPLRVELGLPAPRTVHSGVEGTVNAPERARELGLRALEALQRTHLDSAAGDVGPRGPEAPE